MFDILEQSIYKTVHDFKGGAARLAAKLGANAGTLSNKANPGMEGHCLNLRESIPLQIITNDFRILHSYATSLNHVAIAIGQYDGVSDLALLDIWAECDIKDGEMAAEVKAALADGNITKCELNRIRAAMFASFEPRLELLNRLEGLCDD